MAHQRRSEQVVRVMDAIIAELERSAPELNVPDCPECLSGSFYEVTSAPLDNVFEDGLRRLLDVPDSVDL